MSGRPAISVVLPCHNEGKTLVALIPEISTVLKDLVADYEILVVDDGSSDDTLDVIARLTDSDSRIRVLRHERRHGQSAALLTGVTAARAVWVVTLDGDGQNDPADIPRIWAHATGHVADRPLLVTGHRTSRKDGFRRLLLSRALNAWAAVMLGHPIMDKSCGLKAFQRDAYLALPVFDHMHRFLPALFGVIGGDIKSVPVRHRPRKHGISHYRNLRRLAEGVADVLGIVWLRRRYLPPSLPGSSRPT
jgi:dolichol-phosphate mannosyltransferase